MNKNVVVLFNKLSDNALADEADVLQQLEVVTEALTLLGYKPVKVPFSFDIQYSINMIKSINPAFIFNLVESVESHDELIYFAPAVLEMLKIPYTGISLEVMFITANKVLTKEQLVYHGINTSEWLQLNELEKLQKNEKYILKPLWSEGSLGLDEDSVFAGNDIEFIEKLKNIKDKSSFFIERFIDGREFNISVLGGLDEPEVLPTAEIIFRDYPENKHKVVGYKAKWNADSFEYNNTIRSFSFSKEDDNLLREMKNICIKCWKKFNMKGYTRVDMRIDKNNIPFVLEINPNPCISPDAGFIAAAKQAGMDYKDVVKRIINDLII